MCIVQIGLVQPLPQEQDLKDGQTAADLVGDSKASRTSSSVFGSPRLIPSILGIALIISLIETGMHELLRAVSAEALGQTLERLDQKQVSEQTRPCACGGTLGYQFRRRVVILSVFGRVGYKRRYYTCPTCHQGQAPLDQQLGLNAGKVTAGLAELLALARVEVAFEEASRLVERYLLLRVSDNTIRKEAERFGAL